tara:strand:+ start:87 stop:854 length:768 start_codon:yes stop_codon:yes gene_type:complete
MKNMKYPIEDLIQIMNDLRDKCPWDKKQTLKSLKSLTIEETYELIEAIDKEDYYEIKEELGDLLLHIVFYSKIASEKNRFDFNDVVKSLIEKLIYRHPHIYSDMKVNNEEDVKKNWEKLKSKKSHKGILDGVPKNLPTLIKTSRVQEKVASIGFDFKNINESINKVIEEYNEFSQALISKEKTEIEEEFGDLLFSLVNYSRHIGVDSNECLKNSTNKFISRYKKLEKIIENKNTSIDKLDKSEVNYIWDMVKKMK